MALWIVLLLEAGAALWLFRPWLTHDSPAYLALAEGLAQGRFGSLDGGAFVPEALRPPGYPALLALLVVGLRLPISAVVALQLVMCLAAVALFVRLADEHGLHGDLLLLFVAATPHALAYSAWLMTEGLAILLVALGVFLIARVRPPGGRELFLSGLALAAAALVRPDLVVLPIFLAPAVALRGRASGALRCTAALALGAFVGLAPYAAFNALAFGRPLPTPPAGAWGNSLYTATWEPQLSAADLDSWYTGQPSPALLASGMISEVRRINGLLGVDANTSPFTSEYYPPDLRAAAARLYAREAWTRISNQPAAFALNAVRRLWRLWNTQYQPRRLPSIFAWVAAAAANLVWLLGCLGALRIGLRWRWEPAFLAMPLVVLYLSGVHACLHTEARYTAAGRLPLAFCATLLVSAVLRRRVPSDGSLADEQKVQGAA